MLSKVGHRITWGYRCPYGQGHFWGVWPIEKHWGLGKSVRCAKNLCGLLSMTYMSYDVFLHKKLPFGGHADCNCATIFSNIICLKPLYNKRGKVPVHIYVRSSVTLGVAS